MAWRLMRSSLSGRLLRSIEPVCDTTKAGKPWCLPAARLFTVVSDGQPVAAAAAGDALSAPTAQQQLRQHSSDSGSGEGQQQQRRKRFHDAKTDPHQQHGQWSDRDVQQGAQGEPDRALQRQPMHRHEGGYQQGRDVNQWSHAESDRRYGPRPGDGRDGYRQASRGEGDHTFRANLAAVRVGFPVRLGNFGRLATRRDVQRLLIDCDVSIEDVRVEYDDATLNPRGFWVSLPSEELRKRALQWDGAVLAGRPIAVMAVEPQEFRRAILNPLSMGSRGRYILMAGVQENANLEDIVRFFEGYELLGNPVTIIKQELASPQRRSGRSATGSLRALVRFMRAEDAHRAVREKQRKFLLNSPITLRVLQ